MMVDVLRWVGGCGVNDFLGRPDCFLLFDCGDDGGDDLVRAQSR